MNTKKFSDAMSEIDNKYVDEAILYQHKSKKRGWVKWGALAACLVLAIGIPMAIPQEEIVLSNNSADVTVKYANLPFYFGPGSGSQIYLSEEELFTEYDTAIFKGTITDIDNIVLDFKGSRTYWAIAKIEVEKDYRGPCQEGEIVTVLLPGPIAFGFQTQDTDIIAKMKVGMTGIFMPMIYDEASVREENGATLMLKDIADYGLPDGNRFVFLETKNGLVFSRTAYESIEDAATLEQIDEYVLKMTGSSEH